MLNKEENNFNQKIKFEYIEEIINETDILVNENINDENVDEIEDMNFKGRNSKPPKRVIILIFIFSYKNYFYFIYFFIPFRLIMEQDHVLL